MSTKRMQPARHILELSHTKNDQQISPKLFKIFHAAQDYNTERVTMQF